MIGILKGPEMIIAIANDPILESWGKGKNVIGQSLYKVMPEIIDQGFDKILTNVYTTGEVYKSYETPVNIVRNGATELVYYSFTYQAQRNLAGEIEGIAIIANEVTSHAILNQKILESEKHFKLMAELMPEKVTNATPDGNVMYYNKSWQDFTGANFTELVKNGWTNWIHDDEVAESTKKWMNSVATGEDFNMDLRMKNQAGEYRWHTSKARAVKDENGNIKLWVGYNNDIHDQKTNTESLESAVNFRTEELEKANKALVQKAIEAEESNAKLLSEYSRSLIEASHDPLFTISPEGKIMDVNQATIIATGTFKEILIGSDFITYFTDPNKAKLGYEAVFEKGYVVDYPLIIKDHKLTNVLFNGSVYKNENGEIIGAVVVARDITEQIKFENELKQSLKEITDYKFALDESSIVDVTDAQGLIKYANKNYCKISQYNIEEFIGKTHIIINSGYHSKEFMGELWDTIKKGEIFKGEIKNRAKDGSFYWVNTTIVPFLDENKIPYQYVAIATEITNQKSFENELNEAKVFAEMATEIAQKAKDKAETATEIAENAVKTKQQFLSNMSHEIRTPMNAIIGFTKVVLKTNLSAKQKEYMSAIKMSGDALIVLINDILDLAKVEAGKMTFEQTPFKLFLSIEAMANLFEPRIQEKNLVLVKKYDRNIPDILIGDSVRLHQIIMNLMSNALKFTASGKITMSVKLIEETDDTATIEFAVTDTGIGIAENKLEGVFENFNQATISTSRIYGGTGLGLAIVKQLVESQGGSIHIKSKEGEGSTFSFILTFQKTKEEVVLEPEIMELDREIRDVKVLVVEDMALNQLLMKTLLDDFGFECDITFNGKLAVEKLENATLTSNDAKPYDIILMDLQMPEMNGYEATAHIRNIMKSDIPIIALTADVTSADVAKCKEIGMNDYISKPVNERLLYSKIVALVKKPVIILASQNGVNDIKSVKQKTVDLSYLLQRTKSNPKLMVEMISVYLEQTPPLIFAMKQSLTSKDWKLLEQAVHKMIPSFSIMGMSTDFENMAKKIQEYASSQQMTEGIHDLVYQLEEACTQACEELEIELKRFKNGK
jgi:PAS domain S-box-containing protein